MNNDLTKYMYQHFEDARNIGWNSNEKEADISNIKQTFFENLRIHCERPLNKELNGKYRELEINGEKFVKGFGEIRILDLQKGVRIGASHSYSIIEDYGQQSFHELAKLIDYMIKNHIPLPDIDSFRRFSIEEDRGWGNRFEGKTLSKII